MVEGAPFTELIQSTGDLDQGSAGMKIASSFKFDNKDIVLRKTRWFAGIGNNLEDLLRDHGIDTIVLVKPYNHSLESH